MKGTYYSPPNKTEEKKPASPTGTYYSPPNTTTTPTTKNTTTTPKPTTSTSTTQPSRTTDDIKADIASVVGSGNIDYNKLTSLAGELGGGKETADYIDSLISGQSTQSNVDKEYTYNVPFESAPPPTNEVYTMEPTFDPQQYIRGLIEAQSRQQQYIRDLIEAQRARELAALEAAKIRALTGLDATLGNRKTALEKAKSGYLTNLDTALQSAMENIANQEAKIDPYYYDLRNQAQAGSDVQAMNFAQYMASRGIKGSAAGMPEIYRNAALQGQIGGLNRQQAANQAEIERMRTTTQNQYNTNRANVLSNYEADLLGLTNEYETNRQGMLNAYDQDLLAAQSGIDARGLQAYIDQMNADRLFSLNEAEITGKYKGDLTLAGQEFQQKLDDRAKASWLDTIGRFSDNYQAEIDRVQGDNDTTNDWQIPYLQAERQKKIQAEAERAAAAAAAQSEEEQQAWNNAFKLFQEVGRITSPEQAQILGLPQNATVADVDIARINAATSQMNAQTARINAKTAANKATETSSTNDIDSYVNYIKANFGTNKSQISAYLESLMTAGVDDAIVNALAEKYGL